MTAPCQGRRPRSIAVSGVAGSGKSTLGRALAVSLRTPLLDLDTITNPLLDRLDGGVLGGHWSASEHGRAIRDGRYAALRAVARDVVATAGGAVLVAPFSSEIRGGPAWDDLVDAVAPTTLCLVHLDGDPDLVAARRSTRGELRDTHRPSVDDPIVPAVPHVALAAELTTEQQLFRVRHALGHRTAVDAANSLFDGEFDAVLCDLDGVLVDSTASVTRSWLRFAREYGVSMRALQDNHGRPARTLVENLLGAGRLDEGLARIGAIEVADAPRVAPVPGAAAFFAGLPEHRRAVVTSGNRAIATARLRAAGFPVPTILVTVDDVSRGKPDPEPYLLGARRLGFSPERCLVVEDAQAGVVAARAAGCRVLAVGGTESAEALSAADLVVDGLDRVAVRQEGGALRLALVSR